MTASTQAQNETPKQKQVIRGFESISCAEQQQAILVRNLQTLRKTLSSHLDCQDEVGIAVQSAENAAQHITSFLGHCIDANAASSQPPEESASLALRGFCIAELMERILLFLEACDILIAEQASKDMHSTVVRSLALKHKLFLEADFNAHLTPLCHKIAYPFRPSFQHKLRRSLLAFTDGLTRAFFMGTSRLADLQSIRYGARVSSMLICQPPVFELNVGTTCDCYYNQLDERSDFGTIKSANGITLQELQATA